MVNRRQLRDEGIEHSLETRVSTPGEPRSMEEERISAIYELTDISVLDKDDAKKVLEGIDILKASVTDLVREVQEKVEAVMKTKAETPMTPEKMLEQINAEFVRIGSIMKQRRLPKLPEGCEPLKDKVITMVDDQGDMLELFIVDLTVITDGKASFIKYDGQSIDELARQIMEKNPDVVLMDYKLSKALKGTMVVQKLRNQGYAGEIIGFSSHESASREFASVGVKGTVDKMSENAIAEAAKLVTKK